ncbi:MAG TPA: hypothetical protein VE863_06220 [Pyrinomonadaceae bacterium]|nr:hypothetical protein [Pyrinomonadaceae bacterium]
MNRLLLIFILTFTAATACGQGVIELKTTDGRTVLLKPDGTWEYKKDASEQSTVASRNPPASGDKTTSSLSPNFSGTDPKALFDRLTDLKQRLTKDEFETTAQFEKRAAQEKQKPVLGTLTLADTFTFVISQSPLRLDAEYNADSQQMTLFLSVSRNDRSSVRTYLGGDKKTAWNLADVNVYHIDIDNKAAVFFDDLNGFTLSKKFLDGFMAQYHLNVDEAKRLKNKIKAAVLVQLDEPYAIPSMGEMQFQVRLVDVYFFDQDSGRVLATISSR